MKKRVLTLVLVLFIALLLVSCKPKVAGGETVRDTKALLQQARTGTQGVEIELLQNYPPDLLYDLNELVAIVEVKNKGAKSLEPQDCFVQVTGYDTNIISGTFTQPRSCAEGLGTLEGKSVYNTEGGVNQLEFQSQSVDLPDGVFEYSPNLNFLTCYAYETVANPMVCVDPLFYQITAEQKSCKVRNVGTGGGQGAPLGVTSVGVDMLGSKAVFEINIQNHGTGRVVSRDVDIRSCGQSSLQYSDMDKVYYTVEMSGGSLLNCKPDAFVRLNNNKGKIICTFNIFGQSAYETPLSIKLDYNYINSRSKQVKIIQTPE